MHVFLVYKEFWFENHRQEYRFIFSNPALCQIFQASHEFPVKKLEHKTVFI